MKKVIYLSCMLFGLVGCANHMTSVNIGQKPAYTGLDVELNSPKGVNQGGSYEIHNHYILWGLLQRNDVDATKVCKGRAIKKVVVEQRWYQGLLSAITLGIYSPMQTTIYCK